MAAPVAKMVPSRESSPVPPRGSAPGTSTDSPTRHPRAAASPPLMLDEVFQRIRSGNVFEALDELSTLAESSHQQLDQQKKEITRLKDQVRGLQDLIGRPVIPAGHAPQAPSNGTQAPNPHPSMRPSREAARTPSKPVASPAPRVGNETNHPQATGAGQEERQRSTLPSPARSQKKAPYETTLNSVKTPHQAFDASSRAADVQHTRSPTNDPPEDRRHSGFTRTSSTRQESRQSDDSPVSRKKARTSQNSPRPPSGRRSPDRQSGDAVAKSRSSRGASNNVFLPNTASTPRPNARGDEWWACSDSAWEKMTPKRRALFSRIGLIMETSQGKRANPPCSRCTERGEADCAVFKPGTKKGKACARCRKAGERCVFGEEEEESDD